MRMAMTIASYGQLPRSYDQNKVREIPRQRVRMLVDGAGVVDDQAIPHVEHAITVSSGFGIVGDHDDGLTEIFVQLPENFKNGVGTTSIEIAGGLISKDDFRLVDEGAGDGHALLLAAGEFRGLVIEASGDAEELGEDVEAVRIEAVTVNVLSERDVVAGSERRQKIEFLEDEADFVAAKVGAGGVAEGGKVVPIEHDTASGGAGEGAHDVEHGRFAASRGAHDREKIAGHNVDADTTKSGNFELTRAIDLPKIFSF